MVTYFDHSIVGLHDFMFLSFSISFWGRKTPFFPRFFIRISGIPHSDPGSFHEVPEFLADLTCETLGTRDDTWEMVLNIVIYSKAPKETMGFRGFTHIWDHLGHVKN
jgi:hypothetical protein